MIRNRDAWAGLFFATTGALALYLGHDLKVGTAFEMGPGYFPTGVGLLLIAMGAVNVVRGLAAANPAQVGRFAWRPFLLIPLSVLCFGLVIEEHGLVVGVVALVVLSRLAGRSFRPVETALICVSLAAVASALFVYGLGLPVQLVLPR